MDIDDLKKLVNEFTPNMKKNNKTSFKRKIDRSSIKGVIDISLDDEGYIAKENFKEIPIVKDYKYWILKLDRYYKNPAMRVSQLNLSTLKMYADLCQRLEEELNKENTTVARLQSKLRRENINYDIYYTLYLIAETTVINFYNPLSKKTTSRSLNILENITSGHIRDLIKDKSEELEKKLGEPNKETKAYFNLTDNNKVSLWWDKDGVLRERYNISFKEETAINQISKRHNNLWKDQKIVDILLDMYISTLRNLFDNPNIDTDRIIRLVSPYTFSKQFLDNILIISESNIRKLFGFFSSINTDAATQMISEIDDSKTYNFIKAYQKNYIKGISHRKIHEINTDYFKGNPQKLSDLTKYISSLNLEQKIETIEAYKDFIDLSKLSKRLINDSDENTRIISLYYIYKNNPQASFDKKLFEIINPDNKEEFINLIRDNDLSVGVLERIKDLRKAKIKEISLNRLKIDKSRDDLTETVDMVSQFYDEDDQIEIEVEEKVSSEDDSVQIDNSYKNILVNILDQGNITSDEIKDQALDKGLTVNTYIGEINNALFDYIGDQALVLNGDVVEIDEFYIDMVKELISEN